MTGVANVSFNLDVSTAREEFSKNGFIVERALLNHELCDHLLAVGHKCRGEGDTRYAPIPMPHRAHPEFLKMMRHPDIVSIVEKLVGAPASGLGGEFFFMRPGTPGWLMHQDNAYVQAPADRFVSVWIALCDIGPENGALYFYPGSHTEGTLKVVDVAQPLIDEGQNISAQARHCLLPDEYDPVDLIMKKGDVAFFHSLAVHGSHANVTKDRFRCNLLMTYIQKGQPFRPGSMQKRTEVDLYD